MEFEKMKRKQLQALCKKHGIPANCTNLEMTRLLAKVRRSENVVSEDKEKENEEGVVVDSGNSNSNSEKKKKKVRFSPDVETLEYEPSVFKGRGGRISRKRNVVDYRENRKIVNNNVERNRRGLEKKRRVSDVYEGNSEDRVVVGCKDLTEIKDTSNELGKEGVKGFVCSNVSRQSIVPRKQIAKKTRKQLEDSHLEEVCGGGEEIGKVCLEIANLQSMKRKELQSLCKKHGIPANKTNHEMARLLAPILKENGSSSSAIDGSGTCAEFKLKEEEPLGDNEEVRPCGNEDGVGNVGELKKEEKQVMREETMLPTEAKGFVLRKDNEKKRRKELGDLHLEEVGGGGEEIEKVCLEIGSFQSMKRKELQSLCKHHGIPANKTNLEMAHLLSAAILNVSLEIGSSYSATDGSGTCAEIKLNEEEPDEGRCDEVVRPCGNEDGAGNVEELKEEEKQVRGEETMLPTLMESISQAKPPIQDTKLMTPQITGSLSNTKGYASRSTIEVSGDVLDGLSGFKENSVKEDQNMTPAANDHSPESAPSNIICPPGLGKGMEVEEMSRRKESHDFNAHLTENNRSFQLDVDVHPVLDDIEAQVDDEPNANSEVDHSDTNALGRTLNGEEICCTVPETKDDDRDIGFVLQSDNNNLDQELRNEKELNNASTIGAYEEVLHSQNFRDCPTVIIEESKDVLDASNHDASETFIKPAIPEDLTEALEDHKETTFLESNCTVDVLIDEPFTVLPAPVMDVISSKDTDVGTHVRKLNAQEEDLGCASQIQIVDSNSYEEVSANPHSSGKPGFYQIICGVKVSRMEIVDAMVAPNAEFPTKTVDGETAEVQDLKSSNKLFKDNDSGTKEVAPYLNKNPDERVSQNIHEGSGFSEGCSFKQLKEKETETEFGNPKVSDFMPGIHDNLIEGEPAEQQGHCEDICEIYGEATDNGTHMGFPKTLRMQQTLNGSSSTESPCILSLLFSDEREEFTQIQSAAQETLSETLSEDSRNPIETSETINDSLEINREKSGQLDYLMKKNSIEMVVPENIISRNKPTDARESNENMDDGFTASSKLAEDLIPQAPTSNKNQALQSFTEEIPVYNKSCGNSEKKFIDTFSELNVLPVYELENKTSDAASALVGGNEEYNDGEEPTTDALQESTKSKENVPVMPITENMTNLKKLETIGLEKQLDNACFTDRDERILAGDEISNGLYNISAIKQELTEQVRDKNNNVEINHSFAVEGVSIGAFAGVIVDDELNFSPQVDHIDSKGSVDDLNDEHDGANQHIGNHNVENSRFFRSGNNISTPRSDDKNKGHAMGTYEAPSLQKANVSVLQNKETVDVEGLNLISSSKGETLEDSFAVSIVNASHYDKEQEFVKPDTEAQQLSLKNEDVLVIRENSKMNIETADELEDQHSENVYSVEVEVSELKTCNSRDVFELLHIEEIEQSIMQDHLALKIDQLQGSFSPAIQEEESVEVKTKKDDISALVDVNEQFLREDVPEPDLSVVYQSISCINAAVGQEITSALEDQHGENVHLGGVELERCSNHDVSESLVEEIEHCDLPLKVDQMEGSCSPETHKDENVKVESYPAISKNNEIADLVDVTTETLLSEHVPKLFSSATNQSTSPINAAVGQGTDGENNDQRQMKLPSAETTSLTVKEGENRSAYVKQLKSPAFKSKHSRTVLIHGTPKRAFDSLEMKENIPSTKMRRAGTLTAMTKRHPLKDAASFMQVESYPAIPKNNEIADLVDVTTETLLSEHVPKLFSSATNQSTSPINAAVGQGTDGENNDQSQMKLPSAETTSLTVKEGENQSAYVKKLKSQALKSKYSRTVLIHGTPKRAFDSLEMKENIPSTKMRQAGNLTLRTKRHPLKDIGKM